MELDFARFYRIACASKIKTVASKLLVLVLALALAQASIAQSNISFEWVTVGDPGNPNDPLTGISSGGMPTPTRGAVPYVYCISKYETTIGQYTAFLNAVAKFDPHGLYNPDLGNRDSMRGIVRSGTNGNYVYSVKNVSLPGGLTSANLPIAYITYPDAARFVNWLHNGQGNGSTETGAYTISEGQITRASRSSGVVTLTTAQPHTLNVGDWVTVSSSFSGSFIVTARTDFTFSYLWGGGDDVPEQEEHGSMTGVSATHKPDARYWIPTENEWYKAAYYDPSPQGPADHYWLLPWQSDQLNGRPANFYNGTYTVTGRSKIDASYTYLTDVRDLGETPSHYGTLNQAGNVDEWTEGDGFSRGPHSRGGQWNGQISGEPFDRMASYSPYLFFSFIDSSEIGFRVATVANPPAGGLRNGDKIRFYPRAGHGDRMVGGVFEGSADGSSYTVLYRITEAPPDGWSEVSVNFDRARFLRYRSPDNGQGNVAEIEFYRSGAKVIWAASGTPGSWSGKGNDTFRAAVDGNTSTFFDAPQPNGNYVELDTGEGTPYGTPAGFDHFAS